MYKLFGDAHVVRIEDGATIPKDSKNLDYVDYLEWLSKGNEPAPEFSPAEIAAKEKAVQDAITKQADIDKVLPDWKAVSDKVIGAKDLEELKKIVADFARILYITVKGKVE